MSESVGEGELVLYDAPDGAQFQLRAFGGTVWLAQSEIARLFGTTSQNIGQIVRRVMDDGEADAATTKREFVVRREGSREVRRQVVLHNLDMVLAVGYCVTTPRAIQFRQMYLDHAELQATNRNAMTMDDWATRLDAFLAFNEQELLTHAGRVQAAVAKALAERRYDEFDDARKRRAALEADQADAAVLSELEQKGKQP